MRVLTGVSKVQWMFPKLLVPLTSLSTNSYMRSAATFTGEYC
jgi:hypothetical protein